MDTIRRVTALFTVCIFVVSACPLVVTGAVTVVRNDMDLEDTGISLVELVPDANLTLEQGTAVRSGSGEFSAVWGTADGDHYVDLTFTHEAGTELDFNESTGTYQDMVYVYEQCEWTREELPDRVKLELDFGVAFSDDFVTGWDNPGWSSVYPLSVSVSAWCVDASGNWNELFHSGPPYYQSDSGEPIVTTRKTGLTYSQVVDCFGGMVEDDAGHQEDANDTFTVVVGLTLTHYFYRLPVGGDEPWRHVNGSVTVRLSRVSFEAFTIDPDAAPARLDPTLVVTAPSDGSRFYPSIAVDSGHSFYAASYSTSTDPASPRLVKWSANGDVEWQRPICQQSYDFVRVLSVGNRICTVGGIRHHGEDNAHIVLLTVWDTEGTMTANTTVELEGSPLAFLDAAADAAGHLWVLAAETSGQTLTPLILGVDMSGQVVHTGQLDDFPVQLAVSADGTLVLLMPDRVDAYNSELQHLWSADTHGMVASASVDPSGNVYAIGRPYEDDVPLLPDRGFSLLRLVSEGQADWLSVTRQTIGDRHGDTATSDLSWAVGRPVHAAFAAPAVGTCMALVIGEYLEYSALVKFNASGRLVQSYSLGHISDMLSEYSPGTPVGLAVAPDGLVYLAWPTQVIALDIGLTGGGTGTTGTLLVVAVSAVGVAAVAGAAVLYVRRKRSTVPAIHGPAATPGAGAGPQ